MGDYKMATGKKSAIVYCDWITIFESLEDNEAGMLVKHFFRYINDMNPEAPNRLIGIVFEPIKATLKRDLKNYEKICNRNKDNGLKGGRPKNPSKPKKPSGLTKNPDKPDSDNVTDNETEIVNDNDTKIEIPYQKIADFFNTNRKELPAIQKLSVNRKKHIKARFTDFGLETIEQVILKVSNSDFLQGRKTDWKADFDWILKPDNFLKILEGKYENSQVIKIKNRDPLTENIDNIDYSQVKGL
jgi:hypothetical protein